MSKHKARSGVISIFLLVVFLLVPGTLPAYRVMQFVENNSTNTSVSLTKTTKAQNSYPISKLLTTLSPTPKFDYPGIIKIDKKDVTTTSTSQNNNNSSNNQNSQTTTSQSQNSNSNITQNNNTLSNSSSQNNNTGIVIDKTNVQASLYKDQAVDGLIYGNGFTIFSTGATGWQIKYNEPTQGQGFYESSGGISSTGKSVVRSYINSNKPNGIYTGSAIVQYYLDGVWKDGPTVSYSITLLGPANLGSTLTPTNTPIPTSTPTPTQAPTVTPTPTSTIGGCTPVSFSESKSGDVITVTVSGAWWLSVKANPTQSSTDFDQNQHLIILHFSASSGTVNVYQATYDGAPLCQSYQFGNK